MKIEKIDDGLFRLLIPFEDEIETTVYVVKEAEQTAVIDAATHAHDADRYILPALRDMGIPLERVRCLLLSHAHADHAGGAMRLLERLPHATLHAAFPIDTKRFSMLFDGDLFIGRLRALLLPGHTADSTGFLDLKTKTLLSGDCLQLRGVGKYRNGIALPSSYRQSVKRLWEMDVTRIVAAHEYDPLGSLAEGESAVKAYLSACLDALGEKAI